MADEKKKREEERELKGEKMDENGTMEDKSMGEKKERERETEKSMPGSTSNVCTTFSQFEISNLSSLLWSLARARSCSEVYTHTFTHTYLCTLKLPH